MKTKYLDEEIELLNFLESNNELSDYGRVKLIEFNEIKRLLNSQVVVGSGCTYGQDKEMKAYEKGFQDGAKAGADDVSSRM